MTEKINKILMVVMFSCFIFSNTVEATRPLTKKIMPENVAIIDNGIKYIPNYYYDPKEGRKVFVEAWDISTGKKLWEQMVYEIKYDLSLEHDVQDVFITSLRIFEGRLIVVNEHSDEYEIDLWTKEVRKRELSSKLCESLYDEIENDFDKANFCERDSDCKTISLGGWYINFGCYKFINKAIDENKFYAKIKKYKDDMQCSQLIDECAPSPGPVCVNKRCIRKMENNPKVKEQFK